MRGAATVITTEGQVGPVGVPVIIYGYNARNQAGDNVQLLDGEEGTIIIEEIYAGDQLTTVFNAGVIFPSGCFLHGSTTVTVWYEVL